ncbi:putative helicase MAGATAMA 3 [Vitis vinifera]|uniref:Putative helicase MAGATAMA 3 n=1 Tax=Vitis vinifera TaxID=29760 RepID=A0A438ID05_VITVI|nr:putative helicase MAGATAMA 3 [Vitis vinifera]
MEANWLVPCDGNESGGGFWELIDHTVEEKERRWRSNMEGNPKVSPIPDKFSSRQHYMGSFIVSLIEETRADLSSSIRTACEASESESESSIWEPTSVDTAARELMSIENPSQFKLPRYFLYDVSLKSVEGNGNNAEVYEPQAGDIIALTDKIPYYIESESCYNIALVTGSYGKTSDKLQIQSPKPMMHEQIMSDNKKRRTIYAAGRGCALCSSGSEAFKSVTDLEDRIRSLGLNLSQEEAVLSCISAAMCHHENSVKLIKGPPGTGKTKTVASLLFAVLKMKCRTLACAPTNTAVLRATERLLSFVKGSLENGTYGMGDIVLFGSSGWKHSLESMITLLQNLEGNYNLCLGNREDEGNEEQGKQGKLGKGIFIDEKEEIDKKNFQSLKFSGGECDDFFISQDFVERFDLVHGQLKVYTVNLYTHLPTSMIPLDVMKNMVRALNLLKNLSDLLHSIEEDLDKFEDKGKRIRRLPDLQRRTEVCLQTLRSLGKMFSVPTLANEYKIKSLCLKNAVLIFCTVSSSSKLLHIKDMKAIELLVIDEAAQLKECESTIPLQISGIRHAVLVGDEMQLPALVKSKELEDTKFERSLFERLVSLRHYKHLLDVQYRMHPSISLFPNNEFYEGDIINAPKVKEAIYNRRFLHGNMYGPFSFINVASTVPELEEFNVRHSSKNMVEVAVVSQIIASLFEETKARKEKVSVGIISPYKAQVHEIQKKLGKAYSTDAESQFSIKVSTVDGFQGDEEDVIIISTVRCNSGGHIGFVKNYRRANVSLTRARHCLWITGNAKTLEDSHSVWEKVVQHAKGQRCFYNAYEDTNLAKALIVCFLERYHLDGLFDDKFWESMAKIMNTAVHKEVLSLLEKLSSGWRPKVRNPYAINGTHLMQYVIKRQFHLLWAVDIVEENSCYIQVLKVYNIVPSHETTGVTRDLCASFEKFTIDHINRCKYKSGQGEAPMIWPMHSKGLYRGFH